MLPFLSLITGKSDVWHLCILSSQEISSLPPKFRSTLVAGAQRDYFVREFHLPCPMVHDRVKCCDTDLLEPHQTVLVLHFICHLGLVIWGSGITKPKKSKEKSKEKTLDGSICSSSWPGWYLHRIEDENQVSLGSMRGEVKERGENILSFVWFGFQDFDIEAT